MSLSPGARIGIFEIVDKLGVSVTMAAGGVQLGKPQALFDVAPYFFGGAGRNYDVAPVGKRFAMIKIRNDQRDQRIPITVVVNWTEELRARVK
ncbi:MAG TPA: hypothetical protein VJ813_02715 [Vicinamibacterales bacterium]|nr:hypothetical protein [Vicinamibacterales bacterium]